MTTHIKIKPTPVCCTVYVGAYRGNLMITSVNFTDMTDIGPNAFRGCWNLESIDFGSVQEIDEGAFQGCTSLKKVDICRVSELGNESFAHCTKLNEIIFSSALNTIPLRAFNGCYQLSNITFPFNIKDIRTEAFAHCNLGEFQLPPELEKIGNRAFYYNHCKRVVIPATVHSIGEDAFGVCRLELVILLGKPTRKLHVDAFGSNNHIKKFVLPVKAENYVRGRLGFLYGFTSKKMSLADWKAIGMPRPIKHMIINIILCLRETQRVDPQKSQPVLPVLPYELVLIIVSYVDTGYLLLKRP